MNHFLDLHFSQLTSIWKAAKDNNYSDAHKDSYQSNLAELYEALNNENFTKLEKHEILERKKVIDFFIKSLEFLNTSTLNQIPFETIKCIELALKDWLTDNPFIVVTSLSNHFGRFAFDNTLAIDKYNILINKIYGINFKKKLLQIVLPKELVHDYLTNVVLYHELGHFIDNQLGITELIREKYWDKIKENSGADNDLKKWIPAFNNTKYLKYCLDADAVHIYFDNYLKEYFADAFAAQYIGEAATKYLGYLTDYQDQFTDHHPPTSLRVENIRNFASNQSNWLLENFNDVMKKKLGDKKLKTRYQTITDEDFKKLIPVEIKDHKELHYLYTLGWDLLESGSESIEKANNMVGPLDSHVFYTIINNLIEKSIGNHVIEKNWREHSNVS